MNNHENETLNKPLGDPPAGESLQEDRRIGVAPEAPEAPGASDAFLAKLPPELHSVARRWGEELFAFCNTTGLLGSGFISTRQALGLAVQTMSGAPSKLPLAKQVDQQAGRSLAILEALTNQLAAQLAEAKGWPLADIRECQQDITRAVQLVALDTAPSRLILPH